MPASEKDVAKDNEQGVVPVPADGENHSLLLTITGPFLNFLALHNERKLENPEKFERLRTTFWPFAVAGGFLFGLGIAGGNAFMSGKIDKAAMEAANETTQPDRRRGLRRALAEKHGRADAGASVTSGAAARLAQGNVAAATPAEAPTPITPEARRAALRTASAALGLGTLLACSGAAACVAWTRWYLDVHSAEEFAAYMRARLPGKGLSLWFRDTLGVAAWVEKQEQQRRKRALKAAEEELSKSGALTQDEMEAERARIAAEKLSEQGPVAKARGLVRRSTGL